MAVTIAHQARSQLDRNHRLMPLIATNIVCYQVVGSDAGEISENLDATPPPRQVMGYRGAPRPVTRPSDYLGQGSMPADVMRTTYVEILELVDTLSKTLSAHWNEALRSR